MNIPLKKKKRIIFLPILLIFISGFTQTIFQNKQTIVIDETEEIESIEQIIPIDKVWAGHPVGFSLLTVRIVNK